MSFEMTTYKNEKIVLKSQDVEDLEWGEGEHVTTGEKAVFLRIGKASTVVQKEYVKYLAAFLVDWLEENDSESNCQCPSCVAAREESIN